MSSSVLPDVAGRAPVGGAPARRPADVPDAPTHASLVAAAEAERGAFDPTYRFETGDNWTGLRAEDARDR